MAVNNGKVPAAAPVVPFLRNPGAGPLAFAHRGFSPAGHENSMAAFRAAVALGYRYLELDVRTSKDGVPMVFHDETLDRVTDGTGRIADLTAAELGRVRIGGAEPIPRLEELLMAWPDVRLNMDIKDRAGIRPVAALIERHGAHDRVLVASFAESRRRGVLRRLRRRAAASGGAVSTALLMLPVPPGLARFIGRRLARIDCVQVPLRKGPVAVVTPAFLRRCHRAGLQVHVWTINSVEGMEALLELGVDGLITDRADLLAQVLAARGQWPQRPPAP